MTSTDRNTFKPLKVGKMTLQTRIAMAPLTRIRATEDHIPTSPMVDYYEQRSREPGTLIITEGTFIHSAAGGTAQVPGIWNEDQIKGWKAVFDKVHANGSYAYVQLWALGRQDSPEDLAKKGYDYVAPSAVKIGQVVSSDGTKKPDRPAPRELTHAEIKEYVQWYVQAAKNAIAAGADGVEIHGANGYLIDQFLHFNTNQRTDEYGGSIVNRARFALEVLDAVCEAVGPERVGIRFSPWGGFGDVKVDISPVPQWSYVVAEIERRAQEGKRIAYISTMECRWRQDEALMPLRMPKDLYSLNDFVGFIWTGPWIRSGGMTESLYLSDEDERTILAIGRYFISTPDIIKRLRNGLEVNPYNRETFYHGPDKTFDRSVGYTDYPFYEQK